MRKYTSLIDTIQNKIMRKELDVLPRSAHTQIIGFITQKEYEMTGCPNKCRFVTNEKEISPVRPRENGLNLLTATGGIITQYVEGEEE